MATIETDWSEIPAEYRFTAVDECGNKRAYLHKPELSDTVWCCVQPEDYTFIEYVDEDCENWRESLRERPSVATSIMILDDTAVTGLVNFKELINHNLIFQDKNWNEIGRLEWTNGIMEFSGNATESAKVFMEELQRQFHAAIEQEIERRVKEAKND